VSISSHYYYFIIDCVQYGCLHRIAAELTRHIVIPFEGPIRYGVKFRPKTATISPQWIARTPLCCSTLLQHAGTIRRLAGPDRRPGRNAAAELEKLWVGKAKPLDFVWIKHERVALRAANRPLLTTGIM
jgi:hypothetical protein